MKIKAPAFLACLIFSSCAPSTPQTRIDREPGKYASLSSREQSLVKQGQIARGMSPEAVVLAWGAPDRRFAGSRGSTGTERWDYSASRPVYTHNFSGNYGFSRYGPLGYSGLSPTLGPDVTYIPQNVASVWFSNQRVDSWERAQ